MSTSGPDFGILLTFRNPPGSELSHAENYGRHLGQVRRAEDLGFDTVWLGEHHFSADGHNPSPLIVGSAIAAVTNRIRIAISAMPAPFYNTVRLAEDAAVVDVLSRGRLDVGLVTGYAPDEFAGYGVARDERTGRLIEALDVLPGLWTTDSYSYEGRYNRIEGATLMPKPVQAPHPPIWLGAYGEKMLQRAASRGFHLMSNSVEAALRYDDLLTQNGRDPEDFHIWRSFYVHVAETDDQAWSTASRPFWNLLNEYMPMLVAADDLGGIPEVLPPPEGLRKLFSTMKKEGTPRFDPFFGSPETVAAALQASLRRSRVTHLCLAMDLPGLDHDLVDRSMELFMREVAPRLEAVA